MTLVCGDRRNALVFRQYVAPVTAACFIFPQRSREGGMARRMSPNKQLRTLGRLGRMFPMYYPHTATPDYPWYIGTAVNSFTMCPKRPNCPKASKMALFIGAEVRTVSSAIRPKTAASVLRKGAWIGPQADIAPARHTSADAQGDTLAPYRPPHPLPKRPSLASASRSSRSFTVSENWSASAPVQIKHRP